MRYQDLVESITPDIYERFRRALETGRWPDGRVLSPQQREHCMQAVIAYDQLNHPEEERVGYIDRGKKAGELCDDDDVQSVTWKD